MKNAISMDFTALHLCYMMSIGQDVLNSGSLLFLKINTSKIKLLEAQYLIVTGLAKCSIPLYVVPEYDFPLFLKSGCKQGHLFTQQERLCVKLPCHSQDKKKISKCYLKEDRNPRGPWSQWSGDCIKMIYIHCFLISQRYNFVPSSLQLFKSQLQSCIKCHNSIFQSPSVPCCDCLNLLLNRVWKESFSVKRKKVQERQECRVYYKCIRTLSYVKSYKRQCFKLSNCTTSSALQYPLRHHVCKCVSGILLKITSVFFFIYRIICIYRI